MQFLNPAHWKLMHRWYFCCIHAPEEHHVGKARLHTWQRHRAHKCISLFVICKRALSCDKWHSQRAIEQKDAENSFSRTHHTHTYTGRGQMSSTSWDRSAVCADHGILAPHEAVKKLYLRASANCLTAAVFYTFWHYSFVPIYSLTDLSLLYRNGPLKRHGREKTTAKSLPADNKRMEWVSITLTPLLDIERM